MRKNRILVLFIILLVIMVFIPSYQAQKLSNSRNRGMIYVDDDADLGWYDHTHVKTIQEGIDNATIDDMVFVLNGRYGGNIIINKTINLIGEDRQDTIIDGGKHIIWIFADRVRVSNFNITGSSRFFSAIYATSYDNIISNNNIHNNYDGVRIEGTLNNSVVQNVFSYNYNRNIRLEFSDNCYIAKNYIGGDGDGIYLWSSSKNKIIENTIEKCDWGVLFGDFCTDNHLFHNNLISNEFGNAFDESNQNKWDNGSHSGGNFWSDYTGKDTNDDGIGESSYLISNNAFDEHPIISPINLSMIVAKIRTGFGLNIELKNPADNTINGIIYLRLNNRKDKEIKKLDTTLIELKSYEKLCLTEKILGFGRMKLSLEFGIWRWEQKGLVFGSLWLNIA